MTDYLGMGIVVAAVVALIYFKVIRTPNRSVADVPIANYFSTEYCDPEMVDLPLDQLNLVVFDTETTGLNPDKDDEMIQIGGVRIQRGQLLTDQIIDCLANPGRPIPPQSTLIHGITDEMVASARPPADVITEFKEFCGESVLLAHCAAFDMETVNKTNANRGGMINNAVLDTMLLAYAVEPTHLDLSLETLAEKYSFTIHGRHTAIGDAMATGELFLKLLNPLNAIGIHTLGQSLELCSRLSLKKEFRRD